MAMVGFEPATTVRREKGEREGEGRGRREGEEGGVQVRHCFNLLFKLKFRHCKLKQHRAETEG